MKISLPSLPLENYQKYACNFMYKNKACGIFLDMGMGKTLCVLAAILKIKPKNNILVIAPKSVLNTWESEIKKWKLPIRHKNLTKNDKGKPLTGKKRYEAFDEVLSSPPCLYLINREMVKALIVHYEEKKTCFPYPFVIIDESQGFKGYSSERFKALKRVRNKIDRLILLTGTPSPNSLIDLWSQVYLLDGGKRLGKNITLYKNTFFDVTQTFNGIPVKYSPKKGAEREIQRRIKDIVLSFKRIRKSLPQLHVKTVYVRMDEEEKTMYKDFIKQYIMTLLNDKTGEYVEIEAANAAVLTGKLSQMASGNIYIPDDPKKNYIKIHERKTDKLLEIIKRSPEPYLVAYIFISDRKEISERMKKEGINFKIFDGTQKMIDEWNERKIKVMLLQPQSGGFGINLQEGGENLVWYNIPWNLEHYMQTNARLYRKGQKNNVTIYRIVTEDTIDERIINALGKKTVTQDTLLKAVDKTLEITGVKKPPQKT